MKRKIFPGESKCAKCIYVFSLSNPPFISFEDNLSRIARVIRRNECKR